MASITRPVREQLALFKTLLSGKVYPKGSTEFQAAINWFKVFPGTLNPDEQEEVRNLFCNSFNLTPQEYEEEITGLPALKPEVVGQSKENDLQKAKQMEKEFLQLLPKEGFFADYIKYTQNNESPAAYHFFCAVAGLASVFNRRVGMPWGTGKLYPVLGIIILGPSGLKKTSAGDIIIGLLNELQLVPIYSEKITPEALVEAMKGGNTIGLVYAPEMAVFLGKASYLEGLVPLLTRFMDSPDKWSSSTISRAKVTLEGIGITSLMCSTLDWFINNTPEDMFGGGFIARNLLIIQETSARLFPIPKAADFKLRDKLLFQLTSMHEIQGDVVFTKEAEEAYVEWYLKHKQRHAEFDVLETYYQRKPMHVIRLSMMLHIATHMDLQICTECFERALKIIDWADQFLPKALRQMFKSNAGEEHDFVIKILKAAGGTISHTILVRKTQFKMNASQLRSVLQSLKEAGRVQETLNPTTKTHSYTLTGEVE